jgi:hypothetical protein
MTMTTRDEIKRLMQCCASFDFDAAFGARTDEELRQIRALIAGMSDEQKRAMNQNIQRVITEQRRYERAQAN